MGFSMKPYTTLYRHWIAVSGVGAAEIAVLSGLYARAGADGVCADLVQDELAAELGKSRPWLSAVLTKLQAPEMALVEARRKRGFRGMVYALAGAADSCGQRGDVTGQPADGLLESENPLASQNSSSRRAGGAGERIRINGTSFAEPLASDWQPTADDLAWAAETRPDVDPAAVTGKFVGWCRKANARNGYSPADPSTAWRRWVARELVAPSEAPTDPQGAPAVRQSTATRRPTNRSDQNDRRPASLPQQPGHGLASCNAARNAARNADVLAALRDRLARPA
ncbi:hypothetical protein [Azospirillum rugosum]|uniref:Helix-turn-helix domain-containing protein n=1 Tax=Azospirillum rugosum TaxID=416170 RepID=A0ABS4STW5_9PROT|nr:hypothetical protein [Azospirillum rugosum]MBP2295978.1 hypothetical protein [Azospirillum rugosum]